MSITLNSVSLPNPSTEDIESVVKGAAWKNANGSIQHEYFAQTLIDTITLSWRAVTEVQMEAIRDAASAGMIGTTGYTDIRGDSFTVTSPQSRNPIKIKTVNAPVLRYDITITLEEA